MRWLRLRSLLGLCAAAGGQSQDADEALGVLLIVARAHGEGGQVGAIERVIRLAAYDRDVALVKRQGDGARQVLLRRLHKRVEPFTQRSEPQAEVDELGVLEGDVLFEVEQ